MYLLEDKKLKKQKWYGVRWNNYIYYFINKEQREVYISKNCNYGLKKLKVRTFSGYDIDKMTGCNFILNVKRRNGKKVWEQNEIERLIETNNKMVIRSLEQLVKRQTDWERKIRETKEQNNIGFNSADAKILTGIFDFYQDRKTLSSKQIELVRDRLIKYSRQLTMIANDLI